MTTLVDTSAWVDYLRGTRGRSTTVVRRLLSAAEPDVVICEPVAMELLAGATNVDRLSKLERLVNGLPDLAVEPSIDFRAAADIYRSARRAGLTVRSLNDCLIAAIAIRHDVALVHKDADFEVIADITALRSQSLR